MKQEGYIKDLFHRGGSSTSSLPPEPLYCVVFNFTTGVKTTDISKLGVDDYITQPYLGVVGKDEGSAEDFASEDGEAVILKSMFKESGVSPEDFRSYITELLLNWIPSGDVCDFNLRENDIATFVVGSKDTLKAILKNMSPDQFSVAIGTQSDKISQYAQSYTSEYHEQFDQGNALPAELRHLDA